MKHITPFLPGIAHSQFMRFMVPSGFFVGTATNPWEELKFESLLESKHFLTNTQAGFHRTDLVSQYLQKDGPSAMPCAPGQAGSMQCLT